MKDENVKLTEDVSETATSLLQAAIAHDQLAWTTLVRRYSPRVYIDARNAGLQDYDAAEILQDVFFKVARSLGKLRLDQPGDTFRGWLRTLTKHVIIDWFRRQGRTVSVEATGGSDHWKGIERIEAIDETSIFQTIGLPATLQQSSILKACEESDPIHWQIFQACTVSNLTPEEIANQFGVSRGQVYVIKSRITKKIRKIHEELYNAAMSVSNP